jgi:hypothetical protein
MAIGAKIAVDRARNLDKILPREGYYVRFWFRSMLELSVIDRQQ